MDTIDSRVKTPSKRGIVATPWGPASRVFCVHCGNPGGIVTDEWASVIVWLCDDCFYTYGHIPGYAEVEENAVKKFLKCEEIK